MVGPCQGVWILRNQYDNSLTLGLAWRGALDIMLKESSMEYLNRLPVSLLDCSEQILRRVRNTSLTIYTPRDPVAAFEMLSRNEASNLSVTSRPPRAQDTFIENRFTSLISPFFTSPRPKTLKTAVLHLGEMIVHIHDSDHHVP